MVVNSAVSCVKLASVDNWTYCQSSLVFFWSAWVCVRYVFGVTVICAVPLWCAVGLVEYVSIRLVVMHGTFMPADPRLNIPVQYDICVPSLLLIIAETAFGLRYTCIVNWLHPGRVSWNAVVLGFFPGKRVNQCYAQTLSCRLHTLPSMVFVATPGGFINLIGTAGMDREGIYHDHCWCDLLVTCSYRFLLFVFISIS